jgi:Domain of unknown function (DUF3471)
MLATQNMKLKRLFFVAALLVLALLVSGCQWARWLRLLSLKKQLAQVERYVRIDDQGDLTLHFLKPVVYAEDLSLLIADETARTTNQNRVEWVWIYEKQTAAGTTALAEFDLPFTIGFENSKFSELRFGERFLALMPKPLILGLLRSVGQAEVNIRRGTVAMKWVGPGPDQKVELPTRAQLTSLLGAPFSITESNGTRTCLYKYYQKVPRNCPPCERLAWAKFTFAGEGEEIASSQGVIGNVGWHMVRVQGEPQPRVTFSLEPLSVEPVAINLPDAITTDYIGQYKEPGGTVLNIGRDGEAFVVSWRKENTGGWCEALPEYTNAFFGLPIGLPRGTFLRDTGGAVTGLVAQLEGPGTLFTRFADQPPKPPAAVRVAPAVYSACAGRYKASWGGAVIISHAGEQLFWQNEFVRARVPLYPASETDFFFKAVDSPLTFVRNEQGEVTKLIVHYNGRHAEAVKVKSGKEKDPSS